MLKRESRSSGVMASGQETERNFLILVSSDLRSGICVSCKEESKRVIFKDLDNRLHIIGKLKMRRQLPGLLTGLLGSVIYEFMIFGASTNGKSGDFGSPMWWFESTRPSQNSNSN